MSKLDSSTPVFYLKATDARFFDALWRNAPPAEQNACIALHRLNNAHTVHSAQVLAKQAMHTADVCWTLRQQGFPADLGLAPLLAAHAGIAQAHADIQAQSPATWMRLTPVYWATARDHVNLHELDGDSVDAADWMQTAQSITPWLTELGWEVFVLPREAYIRVESGFDYHAPSLALAQSDILERFLPQGTDLKPWQTLLTELQMLLHTHPINQTRAQRGIPPINSFWLDQTAQAAQFKPEALTQKPWAQSEIQALDYDVTLMALEGLMQPIAKQLKAGKKASLYILNDLPEAGVHQFDFTPPTLWQILKAKLNRNAHHPFVWLTPTFDEDSL